jgi:hypothetical protein
VFGADGILWVEGPTEERCFPIILDHLGLLSSTMSIVSLVAVDDLFGKSRKPELSWDIYQKLSNGTALIPSAIAFSFDREARTEKKIGDIVRASKGLAKYLPRRMFENYLLHPKQIAALVAKLLNDNSIDEDRVKAWLRTTDVEPAKYFPAAYAEFKDDEKWKYQNIDGAKLLSD